MILKSTLVIKCALYLDHNASKCYTMNDSHTISLIHSYMYAWALYMSSSTQHIFILIMIDKPSMQLLRCVVKPLIGFPFFLTLLLITQIIINVLLILNAKFVSSYLSVIIIIISHHT